jgi:dihydroorotate dehydrogenase (NAD+) catalytic subunit
MVNISVDLAGLKLQNPIMTASGTFGYGVEFSDFMDLDDLGAITLKSVTLEPREGNDPPRILETPSGMMNSIGLANCGIKKFVEQKLPALNHLKRVKVIANIAGHTISENEELAKILNKESRVDALELNISCPNVDAGGLAFCQDLNVVTKMVENVKASYKKPLIVKLSTNVSDVGVLAKVCVDSGADILSLINTVPGLEVDVDKKKLYFKRGYAGLSGPAIRPIALKAVYDVAQVVDVPIIGIGGVATIEDVIKFMMVGANAVSVGMMNFSMPNISSQLTKELTTYLKNNKQQIQDLKIV